MRLIFSILFTFLSLLGATSLNSTINKSEYKDSSRYSVEDLIDTTLQTHPTIKMNREIIKGSEAQVQGAKWGYYPTPSISSFQTANNIFGTTLAIEQPLFTGGKLDANYDLALANQKSSEFALNDSAYTLIETLLENIKTYMQGENSYAALLEGQKQLRILEGMVQRRVAAGVSPRADMELLMARLYQMDTDLNFAKTKRDTALAQIEIMTGKSFDHSLKIEQAAPVPEGTLSSVIDEAVNTHPLLKKLDAQKEYAKAEADKTKANIWPTLSLKAQQEFGSSSVSYDLPAYKKPSVYLSIQASTGAGLSAKSAIESSQAKILQTEQEKLVAKQSIINKVMFAYNDYNSARMRISSQKGSVGSSQRVFESYTRLFLAGKRQWLDLVNSSREVTQNEIAFSDAKVIMLISAYQLALYKGDMNLLAISMIAKKDSKETKDESIKTDGYFIEIKESEDKILSEKIRNSRILYTNKDDKILVGPYPTPAEAFNAIHNLQEEISREKNNQELEH